MIKEPPKPTEDDDILEALDQIDEYLLWAKDQVVNNVEVELAGLDDAIEKACDIVRTSDPETKELAEVKITKIVENLEKLAEALRDHPMVSNNDGQG